MQHLARVYYRVDDEAAKSWAEELYRDAIALQGEADFLVAMADYYRRHPLATWGSLPDADALARRSTRAWIVVQSRLGDIAIVRQHSRGPWYLRAWRWMLRH